jgi:phospholipase D1/2
VAVSSSHTKHALEELHPNIAVVRHPDHLPDQATVAADVSNTFKNFKLTAASASNLPGDALKAVYGVAEDTVLYWAHHEKLCIIDGHIAFMGGLDLCYGRWDTHQHEISDVHPSNVYDQVFVGQDYNNARIRDFQDVTQWENNQLDRTKGSRMGWSDVSLSLIGPAVEDLKEHFVERWNFTYSEKYHSRPDPRYTRLEHISIPGEYDIPPQGTMSGTGSGYGSGAERGVTEIKDRFKEHFHRLEDKIQDYGPGRELPGHSGFSCQIVRSCTKWSHGSPLEVSSSGNRDML